ncbi:predicted protein [Scheffersomyces stipitis CBS 6054]|uniref:PHD-type domain-containing protein n=1 Tax=Scheffersomyces stipitis (strain ATCC 58785 / CBS 6054 / NBRC 10063 / NRRL Y-11545) TaxID=322104 RepID=A3LVP5_PICST|nr:predicted protein [Scheffersomyces stipitis CBS 6054]ABN66815.2 predicted protein [Scheffersomyces stipitis CBS 6054]
MPGERRSGRTNKGQHTKRYLDEFEDNAVSIDGTRTKKSRLSNEYENDSHNEEGVVRCNPCGTNQDNYDEEHDKGGTFIQCDECNTWQHAKCMGFKKANIPDLYNCDVCDPSLQEPEPVSKPKPVEELSMKDVLKDDHRVSIGKAFYNYFRKSFPADYNITEEEKDKKATRWALEIEDIIFRTYSGKQYISEGRRILFLLKKYFMKDIIAGTITLSDVVNKTPKEINQDIERIEAENRGNIKNIILTENDHSDIIRRTHKGDIVRENENDEPSYLEESIATRKVDHRIFSADDAPKPRIISDENKFHSYQNLNPRFFDDNDEDEDEVEPVEEEANETSNQQRRTSTERNSSSESSDLEHVTEPIEDELLPILGVESKSPKVGPSVWSGSIEFPDFASFKASANFYSSSNEESRDTSINACYDLMTQNTYSILGRLDRVTADKYLNKIISSRDLYLVEIKSTSDTETEFQKLYQYLLIENKVGVLSGRPEFVKDSYIMPIDFRDSRLPFYLEEHKRDMRIGLFVLFVVKRGYTPVSDAAIAPTHTHSHNVSRNNSISRPEESASTKLGAIMSQLGGGSSYQYV